MTRRTATFVWAALLVVPFAFLAVVRATVGDAAIPELAAPLFWAALAASAVNVALSRLLPPRLGAPRAGGGEALAFARHLVAVSLGEAAALAPVVAWTLTRDGWLLVLAALDVLALAALFPSDRRWDALLALPGGGAPAPGRTVR